MRWRSSRLATLLVSSWRCPSLTASGRLRTGSSSAGSRSNGSERRLRLSLQLASFWSLPRPFLGLELVQRRAYGGRADPLGAAVHIFDAAAPHHPVFARANPGGPDVFAHVPVLLPPTPGVTLRRVGQLLVRKNRALQSQEAAQSTLKVIGLDGHVPLPCSGLRGAKMERVSEVLHLPVIVEGRRPLTQELQPLEKLDFLRGRRAAEGRILQERLEPGLFDEVLFGLELDELKLLHVPGDKSVIENDF